MARLIYQQDSTPQHKRMARRHIRLCGKINGASAYGKAMQISLDILLTKQNERHKAEELCEDTLDDFTLKEVMLDNQVRNLFEHAVRYDRDNISQFAPILFPNLIFSNIINLRAPEKLLKIARIVAKLPHLEAGDEFLPYIETFKTVVNDVNTALKARHAAAENLSRRQADEELARNAVRTQYENNYLEARKSLGKLKAESLFPKVAHRKGKSSGKKNKSTVTESDDPKE